MKYLYFGVK